MPVLTAGQTISTNQIGHNNTSSVNRGTDVASTIDENGNRVLIFSGYGTETLTLVNLGSASSVSQSTYTNFALTYTSGNASASTGWHYQLDHAGLTLQNTLLLGGINSNGTAMSNVY